MLTKVKTTAPGIIVSICAAVMAMYLSSLVPGDVIELL